MPVVMFSLIYWLEDRGPKTEVAFTLVFSESCDAFIFTGRKADIHKLQSMEFILGV